MVTNVSNTNHIGLSKNEYKGLPSSLCQGCGHNSISNQISHQAYAKVADITQYPIKSYLHVMNWGSYQKRS